LVTSYAYTVSASLRVDLQLFTSMAHCKLNGTSVLICHGQIVNGFSSGRLIMGRKTQFCDTRTRSIRINNPLCLFILRLAPSGYVGVHTGGCCAVTSFNWRGMPYDVYFCPGQAETNFELIMLRTILYKSAYCAFSTNRPPHPNK